MEGSLATIGLLELLEMIHENRGSGELRLEVGGLPVHLHFLEGEITGGGILDWEGLEAISTLPLQPQEGWFRFTSAAPAGHGDSAPPPALRFKALIGEWARLYDEWTRFRQLFDSPSRVLEALRASEPYGLFIGGKSIRGAAKIWEVPLIIAAERAWRGLREGDLMPLRKYAWFGLRIRHPTARRTLAGQAPHPDDITVHLDGSRNLGEIVQSGYSIGLVRRYLIQSIRKGEIAPPGKGWLLRDLLWEEEAEHSGTVR
ncbi:MULTISPECIES: DUF4388 domain-containing protein [unclassified Meiothermus]|uniref:DUF4388 domain-containing protein n=1 Tax=unclassified Meiothermus TaxID=370471 RepID=UPI000D7BA659|nr:MULTISPECIES: DUF4388 domain-containing protein [unclassified Meiothermus]PZA08688.1 hypothetical protein DNA98_01155 [Meiothermus sp. Pnk-1]RYM40694.1 DUF4388 domain-containing protein [Meiothermus sp. PNK-Is4]